MSAKGAVLIRISQPRQNKTSQRAPTLQSAATPLTTLVTFFLRPDGLISPHTWYIMRSLGHGYGKSSWRTRSGFDDPSKSLGSTEAQDCLIRAVSGPRGTINGLLRRAFSCPKLLGDRLGCIQSLTRPLLAHIRHVDEFRANLPNAFECVVD